MGSLLQSLLIRQRIWMLVACCMIGLIAVATIAVTKARNQYFQLKQEEYIKLTNTAKKTIEYFYNAHQQGKLTELEARQQAKAAIKAIALDDRNYSMIFHTSEMLLAHPFLDFAYNDDTPEIYQRSLKINREGKKTGGERIGLDGPIIDLMTVIKETHPNDYTGFTEYYIYYAGEEKTPVTQPITVDPAKLPAGTFRKMAYSTYFEPWNWVVISGIYREDEKAAFNDWLISMMTISGVIILILFVAAWVISNSVTKPLDSIVKIMEDISHGTGDLTKRLAVEGRDELSQVANAFNIFVEKISSIVGKVAHTNGSILQVSSSISQVMKSTVTRSEKQLSETEMLASAANELSYSVKSVAERAQDSSSAAGSAEESAKKSMVSMSKNISSIRKLSDALLNTQSQVASMETFSNKVSSVLEVIVGIAEQTNLLALNAAIEAARAGEQGRGFAVVADEVRTLAQRTQSSTTEIHDIIENLQKGTSGVVHAMQDGLAHSEICVETATDANDVLQLVSDFVAKITQMNIEIASAVEQQSKVTLEIAESSQTIADSSRDNLKDAESNSKSSGDMHRDAESMNDLIRQFKV